MPLATQIAKESKYSPIELKVQAVARRRAEAQLMRVPWPRFRKAYEVYPRWHALTLWTQLIIATQDRTPPWLIADLRKLCRGFTLPEVGQPKPLDLHVSEWVGQRKFGYAKRQGWLDALTFYGVRHLRSERAWNYWEQCDRDWNRDQPQAFPSFDVWWRDAQKMKFCDKLSSGEIARMVLKYLNWEALELWFRPLFASRAKLPPHMLSELKQACPRVIELRNSGAFKGGKDSSEIWRDLKRCCRDQLLSDARREGVLDAVIRRAQSHPLHVRLASYGTHWSRNWLKTHEQPYPSFRQWWRAAGSYIRE